MSKELIKRYADIDYPNNKSMNNYILKSTSEVIETSKGYLIRFEKPSIKTRFCFGHGCNGISTSEDVKNACNMAQNARTNEQYFIEKNLEGINERIKEYEENNLYYSDLKTGILKSIVSENVLNHFRNGIHNEEQVSKQDKELILNTLKSEKTKFEKRLNTYLKRYGLSKIHSWTYLVD